VSGRVAAGAALLLVALAVILGGVALVGVHASHRDADGFYATDAARLATPTHAFVSDELDVDTGGAGLLLDEGRLGTLRVTATAAAKPVFVGVARTAAVASYLRGVSYAEVADFEVDPLSVTTRLRPGSAAASPPGSEPFWADSASGSGTQSLSWPVERGDWAVVVMNADGSAGVRTDVSVGAKVPAVLWIGIGLLVAGIALGAGGGALLRSGLRDAIPVGPPVAEGV
jgi:hypothetical protein